MVLKTLVVGLGVTLWLPLTAQAAEEPAQSAGSATPAKCLEAAVNPVTGDAICVNPRGAPVEPPPKAAFQPCKPRAHDSDPWTVYEHASGCGD
jgi:glucose dehydrogenase